VRDVATKRGVTPGQVAIAWLLARGPDVVPIPGSKKRQHLEENCGAAGVTLGAQEITELDAALAAEKVSGPRYNPRQMTMVDR
jgi:aryl-alcohol dehydrogenase-like predicted oxidoreductase